ncbi:MAG: hypothetical protein ACYC8T_02880 [Myxococcaceae bacterium]
MALVLRNSLRIWALTVGATLFAWAVLDWLGYSAFVASTYY